MLYGKNNGRESKMMHEVIINKYLVSLACDTELGKESHVLAFLDVITSGQPLLPWEVTIA